MDVRRAFAELSDEERMILAVNIFWRIYEQGDRKALHMSSNTVRSKQSRALKEDGSLPGEIERGGAAMDEKKMLERIKKSAEPIDASNP